MKELKLRTQSLMLLKCLCIVLWIRTMHAIKQPPIVFATEQTAHVLNRAIVAIGSSASCSRSNRFTCLSRLESTFF